MIITKSSSFREVLSSRGGLHLTAYVKGSKDPVEVRRKIGGVVFSALEQLVEASGVAMDRLCRACFDGVYPVELPEPELAKL